MSRKMNTGTKHEVYHTWRRLQFSLVIGPTRLVMFSYTLVTGLIGKIDRIRLEVKLRQGRSLKSDKTLKQDTDLEQC